MFTFKVIAKHFNRMNHHSKVFIIICFQVFPSRVIKFYLALATISDEITT